jgi:hypothetical protein
MLSALNDFVLATMGSKGTFCTLKQGLSFSREMSVICDVGTLVLVWSNIHMGITRSSLSCEKGTNTLWLVWLIRVFYYWWLSWMCKSQVHPLFGITCLNVVRMSTRYTLGIGFTFKMPSKDSFFSDVGGYSRDILNQSLDRFLGYLYDGGSMQTC